VLNVAVALVPVVVFLAGLALLDSFRLVRPLSIAAALAYGAAAAGASLQIHEWPRSTAASCRRLPKRSFC
jgi:hypothetical protein